MMPADVTDWHKTDLPGALSISVVGGKAEVVRADGDFRF